LVALGGGKWWRLKYRFDGKEKRLALGLNRQCNTGIPDKLRGATTS